MKDRRRLLLVGLLLTAFACAAQDSAADLDPDDDTAATAVMYLHFDQRGSIDVSFDLPQESGPAPSVQMALTQALHCPAGVLRNSYAGAMTSYPANWTEGHRERYAKQVGRITERHLEGTCNAVLARQEGVIRADFDYSALAAELEQDGVDQLDLFVDIPKTTFREYPHDHLYTDELVGPSFLAYRIPLGTVESEHTLHIAFGLRRADVHRAFAILAGFLLVPVIVTLWMRRSALASARTDAARAWFGFFRNQGWMLMVTVVLWITSNFGARSVLAEWIADHGYEDWQAGALNAVIAMGPVLLIYFVCSALSYRVHAEVRGTYKSRREFLVGQAVAIAAKTYVFMLALVCLELTREHLEFALLLLLTTVVLFQVLQIVKLRVIKSAPRPVTTGELRERILALAGRLRVQVSQIFVLPTGNSQVANAYAAKTKTVIFTDCLLEHLTKREVDAIAAHELAHLKHKHPVKRGAVFALVMFLPACFSWFRSMLAGAMMFGVMTESRGAMQWLSARLLEFDRWSQKDFVLVMLGLMGFYFLARHHEKVADETAVRLTNDPEAQITGLLKVNRLNFVPIQWGKAGGIWMTHPATVSRVQRIAAAGGMAPERLQQILAQYNAEPVVARAAVPAVASEDGYPIPDAVDADLSRSDANRRAMIRVKAWVMRLIYVIPPAIFSLLLKGIHPVSVGAALVCSLTGIVLTGAIVLVASVWIAREGYGREKLRMRRRFERDHVPVGKAEDVFVGIAPTPFPRIFGEFYDWDRGFLKLASGRLQFVGEKTRFGLMPGEIDAIVLGPAGPNWWKLERIYLRWKDAANNRSGIINLFPMEPGSVWRTRAVVRELYDRLQAWQKNPASYPAVHEELSGLASPDIGGVKCVSPKVIGTMKANLKTLGYLIPMAAGVSLIFNVSMWYLCQTVILVRVFQSIPYWRYQDRPPLALHAAEAIKVRSATASDGK